MDIINVAGRPVWFDEAGVPRYVEFSPKLVTNIGAQEIALLKIRCQDCGRAFMVAKSWSKYDSVLLNGKIGATPKITDGDFEYGDPPNVKCCSSGYTKSSETISVVELWLKDDKSGAYVKAEQSVIKQLNALVQAHLDELSTEV